MSDKLVNTDHLRMAAARSRQLSAQVAQSAAEAIEEIAAGAVTMEQVTAAIQAAVNGAPTGGEVPAGAIMMWSGAADAIPSGWSLCDGTNNTPDLRGKFVLGAGGTYSPGNTGGSEEVTLTVEQMPSHCHDYDEGKEGKFKDGTTLYGKTTLQSKLAQGLGTTENAGDGQPHPNMPPYYALCYIMKAAGGSSGNMYTAGVDWWETTLPSSARWETIIFGGGKFVALTKNDEKAAYSADGINWTEVALPFKNSGSIAYGNGIFVAENGYGNKAFYSVDGINWAEAILPSTQSWTRVTYGDGKFVMVTSDNKAAYSTNGITWEAATLPYSGDWYSITYGNGKFVAVAFGRNKAAYSTDGITWEAATLPSNANWRSVTYGDGNFVAIESGDAKAAYSRDGITWTAVDLPFSADWRNITYGGGKFIAVANNRDKAAYSSAKGPEA